MLTHDPIASSPIEPDHRRLPDGLLIALAMVAAAILVGGGLFLATRADGTDTEVVAPEPTAVPTTQAPATDESAPITEPPVADQPEDEGTSTPDFAPIVCPDGTEALFCELVAFVEQARGRPFQTFPDIELAGEGEFQEMLLVDFEEDSSELEALGDTLRSLGLIEADADIVEQYRGLLEIGVVGFYNPETGQLVVRGGEFNLYAQSVLVHELAHAHDDQWLDLDRPEFDDAEDERGAGFTAVVEGNAVRVEDAWKATLTPDEVTLLDQQGFELIQPEDFGRLSQLPQFLIQSLQWPYTDGAAFIDRIAQEGEEAVDAAFDNPPRSTEQVVNPEQYLAGETVETLPLPDFSGEQIDDGIIGELGFRFWLGFDPADGWGSDRYVTYRPDADTVCTRIDVTMDSEADVAELEAAIEQWVRAAGGREVQNQDDTLRITGCL